MAEILPLYGHGQIPFTVHWGDYLFILFFFLYGPAGKLPSDLMKVFPLVTLPAYKSRSNAPKGGATGLNFGSL